MVPLKITGILDLMRLVLCIHLGGKANLSTQGGEGGEGRRPEAGLLSAPTEVREGRGGKETRGWAAFSTQGGEGGEGRGQEAGLLSAPRE